MATLLFYHTMSSQNIFDKLLIFVILYQDAKNYIASLICSGKMVDLKVLEFDWLRPFWPISQKQDFPKYMICTGTQQII